MSYFLLRKFLVVASALVYEAGALLNARRVRKKIGRLPNLTPRSVLEKWLWLGWAVIVAGWFLQAALLGEEGSWVFRRLTGFGAVAPGAVLIILGLAGTWWSYAAMDVSWRMAVDPGETTKLVHDGPYRWVRHPIYLLQVVIQAGFFLLLPTVFSIGLLFIHLVCVHFKMADEEKYLSAAHGARYEEYRKRTGKWLPRL